MTNDQSMLPVNKHIYTTFYIESLNIYDMTAISELHQWLCLKVKNV